MTFPGRSIILVRLRPFKGIVLSLTFSGMGLACIVVFAKGYATGGRLAKYALMAVGCFALLSGIWLLCSNLLKRFAVLRFRRNGVLEVVYPLGMSKLANGPISMPVASRREVTVEAVERLPNRKFVDFTVRHRDHVLEFEVSRSILDSDWQERFDTWRTQDGGTTPADPPPRRKR